MTTTNIAFKLSLYLYLIFSMKLLSAQHEINPFIIEGHNVAPTNMSDRILYYIDHSNLLSFSDIHTNRHVISFIPNVSKRLSLGLNDSPVWLYFPVFYQPIDKEAIHLQLFFRSPNTLPDFDVFTYHQQSSLPINTFNEKVTYTGRNNPDITMQEKGIYHIYIRLSQQGFVNFQLLMVPSGTSPEDASLSLGSYSGFFLGIIFTGIISGLFFWLSPAPPKQVGYFMALGIATFMLIILYSGSIAVTTHTYRFFVELLYSSIYLALLHEFIRTKIPNFTFIFKASLYALILIPVSLALPYSTQVVVISSVILTQMLIILSSVCYYTINRGIRPYFILCLPAPLIFITDSLLILSGHAVFTKASMLGQGLLVIQYLLLLFGAVVLIFNYFQLNKSYYSSWEKRMTEQLHQLSMETQNLIAGNFKERIELQNFSDIQQLAYDLNTLSHVLEDSQRSRKQWIADISHELRTPLTILKGEMEAIIDGVRPFNKSVIESFHQETCRLTNLVQDLHELSLSDQANFNLQCSDIDVESLITQQLSLYASTLEEHKIQVNTHLAQHHILTIDVNRFIQLLVNLLKNTIKYTDSPGKLSISTHASEQQWVMRWQDSPPGVPEQLQVQLFNRLFRAERSRNSRSGGSGLGLSLCKTIVEAHKGRIDAKSSPLGGLSIEVVLPIDVAKNC